MTIRIQRGVIWTYLAVCMLPVIGILFSDDELLGKFIVTSFFAVPASPAIGFLAGVRWCRSVLGIISILSLLLWSISPLAQHAIDRHLAFWIVWALVELLLVATIAACFIRTSDEKTA